MSNCISLLPSGVPNVPHEAGRHRVGDPTHPCGAEGAQGHAERRTAVQGSGGQRAEATRGDGLQGEEEPRDRTAEDEEGGGGEEDAAREDREETGRLLCLLLFFPSLAVSVCLSVSVNASVCVSVYVYLCLFSLSLSMFVTLCLCVCVSLSVCP